MRKIKIKEGDLKKVKLMARHTNAKKMLRDEAEEKYIKAHLKQWDALYEMYPEIKKGGDVKTVTLNHSTWELECR